MIAILIFLICLCFWGTRIVPIGFVQDYLSKDQCNVVKGFFILLVFLSHINSYILKCGYNILSFGDTYYFKIVGEIGQLMVVMFLFFSGYGVMESFKKKGDDYVLSMPKKRILTTLLNFDIAVLFFIVLNVVLRRPMTTSQIFLSFIAWDSVGNSNWYIFCILLCYSFSFLVLSLHGWSKMYLNNYGLIFIIFVFSILAMIVLSYHKASWWYNTMLCFPFGMFFSEFKVKAFNLIRSSYSKFLISIFLLFFSFHFIPFSLSGLSFNIKSMLFSLIIISFMMKLELKNKYLRWFGERLFPLYIYQRLPMIAIFSISQGKDFISSYPLVYILACFSVTVFIAFFYPKWRITLDK